MCKNSWRGQIVLSLLNLEVEFAVLHNPGFCCRGSILLACTAAFLQDWINGLLFIVYHSGNLCFIQGNNITNLWDRRRFLRSWLWWSDLPCLLLCSGLEQTELVQTPHAPSWLLPLDALESALPVCSLMVPCQQSSCVTWVEPVGLWSGREEGALGPFSLCPVVKEQQLLCVA